MLKIDLRLLSILILAQFALLAAFTTKAFEPSSATGSRKDVYDEPFGMVPARDHIAEISLDISEGRQRRIMIHRASGSSTEGAPYYFHRPIFAFVPKETYKTGLDIIWNKTTKNQITVYVFRVVESTRDFIDSAIPIILNEDKSLREQEFDINDIRLSSWPLTHVIVKAIDSDNYHVIYGEGETASLVSEGDQWNLNIWVDSSVSGSFEERLKANKVSFRFSYSYKNVIEERAQRVSNYTSDVIQEVDDFLSSVQVDERQPLFRGYYNNLSDRLRTRITSGTYATGINAAGLLSKDLLSVIVSSPKTMTLQELYEQEPSAFKSLNLYLQPLIDKIAERRRATQTGTETETHKETATKKETFEIDIGKPSSMGKSGLNIQTTLVDEDITKLEQVSGIDFELDESRNVYVPHRIELYRFSSSWQQNLKNSVDRAFLATGTSDQYALDSPIPVDFTIDSIAVGVHRDQLAIANQLVPLGAALCYFGKTLPPGYAWADGKTNWPNESWLPHEMLAKSGSSLPKMNQEGVLVGGTNLMATLGELSRPGVLTLPSYLVEGSGFTALLKHASKGQKQLHNVIEYPKAKVERVLLFAEKSNCWDEDCTTSLYVKPYRIEIDSHDSYVNSAKISGRVTLPEKTILLDEHAAPPHIKCRWIIRVK